MDTPADKARQRVTEDDLMHPCEDASIQAASFSSLLTYCCYTIVKVGGGGGTGHSRVDGVAVLTKWY